MCHLYPLFQYSEACATLHVVSQCQVRKRHQHFHFFWFHHGQNSSVNGKSDLSFFFIRQTELITPTRDRRVDTDLVHSHWSEWYFHLFSASRFRDSKAQVLVKIRWPVSLNCCTMLLAVRSWWNLTNVRDSQQNLRSPKHMTIAGKRIYFYDTSQFGA